MKYLFLIISVLFLLSCGSESTPTYSLSTSVIGEGIITPSGGDYEEGEIVTITGIPPNGWLFMRWEGDWSGESNPTSITMNKNFSLVGVFERIDYPLTIIIEGEGTVEEQIISSLKTTEFPYETVIKLTATPATGWSFVKWGGDLTSTEPVIEVTVTDEMQLTVTFIKGCGPISFTYRETEVTYGTVIGANDRCWLDRNLGASRVPQSRNDSQSYGDLFQWGRGDDGHQERYSRTTTILSSTDTPGQDKFILSDSGANFDWRNPQNTNLWQGVNGINNPCPTGFRLPNETEWIAERESWSIKDATGALSSPLKMPEAGYRDYINGALYTVGSSGYYWSDTFSDLSSRALLFFDSGAISIGSHRAYGNSVRCIKD